MRRGVLDEGELLDAKGRLCEGGYAFSQVKRYDRNAVKANKLRIKEWDYYSFCDDDCALALTVADNSYMSLASVSVLDFKRLRYVTKSTVGLLPNGKLGMPSDCTNGDVLHDRGGVTMRFTVNPDGSRKLSCSYKKFYGKTDFNCELDIAPALGDNITVAVPFKKKKQFYYNTKMNCLKCDGRFEFGDITHNFSGAYGGLDWGRGVWPFKNKWYWSSLSCDVNGTPFGLNLGYGFGKPIASENVAFYAGKANKLGEVKFDIPYTQDKPDYLKPWKIADDVGRLELIFYPMIDRTDKMHALWLMTDQHQVFGKFFGKVTLDDGTLVTVSDKIGFAECVKNRW